jgi:TPR repeat protein/uncharacterized membrane protein YhaH (DUF805 family)
MNRLLILPVLLLILLVGTPAFSADLQKGLTAYQSGDYATALREWTPLAEQGNAEVQHLVGFIYRNGLGVTQNFKTAVKWYKLSAAQKYASAQFNLGTMYRNGLGVQKNNRTAVKWYRLAAKQGNASAQSNLGLMYAGGLGVPKNYKTAVRWYKLAAEQGFALAQHNLGAMYDEGQGVPQDYKTAVKWYKLAAEQGDAGAQFNLGNMYNEGKSVPKNYKTAVRWWTLAAQQGDPRMQGFLGSVYEEGKKVPQDSRTAVKWYRLAAEQGLSLSQYDLGMAYMKGRGVPQNFKEAARWTRRSAEQGYAKSQFILGGMYAMGQGVIRDPIIAYMWAQVGISSGFKVVGEKEVYVLNFIKQGMTPFQLKESKKLALECVGRKFKGCDNLFYQKDADDYFQKSLIEFIRQVVLLDRNIKGIKPYIVKNLRINFPTFEPNYLYNLIIVSHFLLVIGGLLSAVTFGKKKISRLSYFLKFSICLISIVILFSNPSITLVTDVHLINVYIFIVTFLVIVFFLYRVLSQRLRDCGMHWAWAYLALIPVIGFLIYVYAFFGKSKTLDYEEDDSSKAFAEVKKYEERIEPTFGKRDN